MDFTFMPTFWEFFRTFAPSIPVPSLYWNVRSAEQRVHDICHWLGVLIEYCNVTGIKVDELQTLVKSFEDGHIDPIIQQAVEDWFTTNQPQIMQDIADLKAADILLDERIDTLEADVNDLLRRNYAAPEFRTIARYIAADTKASGQNFSSAQAGCVFEQGGRRYWAQILAHPTANSDRLDIIDIDMNRNITAAPYGTAYTGELGHGYTVSYDPDAKQLITQDSSASPRTIVRISVNDPYNPTEYSRRSLPVDMYVDNLFYHTPGKLAGFTNNNDVIVFDESTFDIINTYHTDFYDRYPYTRPFTFQSGQYDADSDTWYFGISKADGVIVAKLDEATSTIRMFDFICSKPYYAWVYMRELEFACRVGDKLYINTYDVIDSQLVPALFEWDLVNGTIAGEISPQIDTDAQFSSGIDFTNGHLLPDDVDDDNKYMLAGDAINRCRIFNPTGRVNLTFFGSYPAIVNTLGVKCAFASDSTYPATIKGINAYNSDVYVNGTNMSIQPEQVVTVGGTDRYIAIKGTYSHITLRTGWGSLDNPQGRANPIWLYTEFCNIDAGRITGTCPNKMYLRSGNVTANSDKANLNYERLDHMGVSESVTLP